MRVVPIDFVPIAPATAAVYRVVDGERRYVVKILRSPRHWPMFAEFPEELRERLLADFPWRDEADFLVSDFVLPPGMRRPEVFRVDELGGRIGLWLEDVVCADVRWDLDRFVRAARLLGRWAGRRFGGEPSTALRYFAGQLAEKDVAGLLDRLDALPQAIGHGDACPQNLLVPADAPDEFVVIDVTWQCPQPVGADLGQLLVGLAHDGTLDVTELPAIREAIIDAYTDGLAAEDRRVTRQDVAFGCDGWLAIRSASRSGPKLTEYLNGLTRHLIA